ncbi:MAG: sporulation integral membrane protein YtvI [Defluviitaleaceae bacterium]|nr:sporulation integral membrane protein YtvI [Defluviitaleaceae bacterium]
MREFYHEHKDRIDRILFFALVTITVYLFFTVLFVYLAPFFFGVIIALIMEPLIRFMGGLRIKRWIASLICLVLFLTVISSIGVWLFNTLARQVVSFIENAPAHAEEIADRLDEANLWLARLGENLPEGWYIPDIQEMILTAGPAIVGEGMRDTGLRTLGNVPDYFINVILALVSAYFFMADGKNIFASIKKACPNWIMKQMNRTKKGLVRAMSGYFRAQGILMIMVGIISIIGLMLPPIRSPYALLLGLLFAVLDFLPILGPAIVLIPWALLSLAIGNMHQAIALAIMYGVITISRQVLQPKILGHQMGAHPLASLMSIYIGFRIFGLLGFIIGPTLLVVFIAVRETNTEGALECSTQKNEKSV